MAADLLQNPRIQAVLSERMAERERRTEITQDAVLREIARIAFVDPSEIFQIRSGCVVVADTEEMSEDARRALVSVTETTTKDGGSLRVQLASKLEALQLLGKHLGMFPVESRVKADVKAEIDGNVSVGVLVLPAADLGEE
jgi:phage terminase small subunit